MQQECNADSVSVWSFKVFHLNQSSCTRAVRKEMDL